MAKHKRATYKEDTPTKDMSQRGVYDNEACKEACSILIVSLKENILDTAQQVSFLKDLDNYIEDHERLLYSVISKIVYSAAEKELEALEGNVRALLHIAVSKKHPNKKVLMKLYDHLQLALSQFVVSTKLRAELESEISRLNSETEEIQINVTTAENQLKKIEKDIKDTQKDIKDTQKDYITILGIFASLVLAFAGGMAFNTSVLQYMHESSIYKVVFVLILLMQSTLHLVYLLFDFIYKIYKDESSEYPQWLKMFNLASGTIIFVDILMYFSLTQ